MPNTRMIRRDGKNWMFTPGKTGSTVSVEKVQPKPLELANPSVAKVVPSPYATPRTKKPKVSPEIRRARQNLAPVLVGSNRG